MRYPSVELASVTDSVDYGHTASATMNIAGPKFLRITDIQDGHVDWASVPFCVASAQEEKVSQLDVGDIVFARTGATTGKSFFIRECPERAVFASYLIRVRPNRQIRSDFLARFFETQDYWAQIARNVRGAAQGGVNASTLRSLRVPLPPLNEQRRVAAILDQADELRRNRRRALERIRRLADAIFEEMFGDPIRNDRGWQILSVGEFVAAFEGGKNLVADDAENPLATYRVLKVSGVGRDGYDPRESKALPVGYNPPKRHFITKGDLLISRANTSELVGRVALVYDTPDNLILPDKIWRFVWREPVIVDTRYVEALFRHPATRYELGRLATGTSGSMKNISQAKLMALRVAVPPLHVQKVFSAHLRCIEGVTSNYRAYLAKLDALFVSLQQRAFQGELTWASARGELEMAS
jgi:type I restriction enzyme S subunit